MLADPLEKHASRLADAALAFGRAERVEDFLQAVAEAIGPFPHTGPAAIGLYDARRARLIISYAPRSGRRPGSPVREIESDGQEHPVDSATVKRWLTDEAVVLDDPDAASGCVARFFENGADRVVSSGLHTGDALAGVLFVATSGRTNELPELRPFVAALAQIATPAFLNYRTRDRLAKGDRRRTSLVELSQAINHSLRFNAVVTSALDAIRGIEGHLVSVIGLVEGTELSAFWNDGDSPGGEAPGGERMPVGGSPFDVVIQEQRIYESGDLQRETAFELDRRLGAHGVRRYTVAPMYARGRPMGGFLFGTGDPHPALTTDVWMYENIALQLALAIDNARQFEELQRLTEQLAQQNVYLQEEIATEHNVEGMIGRSSGIRRVFNQIVRVAETDAAVLVTGQTGTGKELVARAVHARSGRAEKPLVKINCAAIPENLVESELFGHERGAFTSATSRRIGRFELAREGTLFLDEVGELPLSIQAKLLRVLQDGEFERVGGSETIQTNARIIAATNRDLSVAVANGTFRSDLYYRLNVFPIDVPPLENRREDIPLLVESFISQFNRRMGKHIRAVEADSMERLMQRDWPGNIRELRHVIERAMILCDGELLTPAHTADAAQMSASSGTATLGPAERRLLDASALDEVERLHIERVLRITNGVIEGADGAAARLGLKPSTLRSRMKRLGVRRAAGPAVDPGSR